jgi:glycosyltransferase involved in cell wall biosynthesis
MNNGFANQPLKPLGYVAATICNLYHFLQTSRTLLTMSMEKKQLSVVIVACNEIKTLPRLFDTISFADEIIVVDSGSTDGSIQWVKKNGGIVVSKTWSGFVSQKNFAIQQANYDWVLSLDADEWLSIELQQEIQLTLENPKADSYLLERSNHWIEKPLRFGIFGRDKCIRLFRKGEGEWGGVEPHDQYRCNGHIASLGGVLHHQPYDSIEDHFEHIKRYTSLAADDLYKKGRSAYVWDVIIRPAWHVFVAIFIRLGWLDGIRGVIVALLGGYYVLLKWSKLLWKQQQSL